MSYPQPGVPFARIYFGGRDVTGHPNLTLQSFEYERSTQGGSVNRASFVLIDESWTILEQELTSNQKFSFEYGWIDDEEGARAGTKGARWSPRYEMALTKYQPRLCNSHVEISAEGKSLANLIRPDAPTVAGQTNNVLKTRYSDVIKELWGLRGFGVSKVDETDEFGKRFNSHNSTLPTHQKHLLTGLTPVQSLIQDGKFRSTGDNYSKAGFFGFHIDTEGSPEIAYKKKWAAVLRTDAHYYLVPDVGKYEVITFEPVMDKMGMLATAGNQESSTLGVGVTTGKTAVDKARNAAQDNLYGARLGGRGGGPNESATRTGLAETSHTPEEAKQYVLSFYDDRAKYINEATLVIVGDPDQYICDQITVMVSMTGKGGGGWHYTSGKYLVVGIKDAINPGDYQTTLTLKKLEAYNPQTDTFYGID